jgi:phage shock protein E
MTSLLLFSACAAHGAQAADPTVTKSGNQDVSVEAAAEMIANDPDVVVLDIRTAAEFEAGHIPGAIQIDCNSEGFVEELRKLDPSKTYVMH